jgi:hypothetical protein
MPISAVSWSGEGRMSGGSMFKGRWKVSALHDWRRAIEASSVADYIIRRVGGSTFKHSTVHSRLPYYSTACFTMQLSPREKGRFARDIK